MLTLNTVRLLAYGDRFKGLNGYDGGGFTLFEIPIPFLNRADRKPNGAESVKSKNYKRYQEPMQKFRTFDEESRAGSDPSKGGTGIDCRWYEFYRCDNLRDKGFKWALRRHDLRVPLAATVVKIHKKLWNREVAGFTLSLDELRLGERRKTGLKIWASASVVENDCVGQNTLHKGEVVFLDLGENRILPLRNYYTPAKCPQCKKPHYFTMPEYFPFNSDGVCKQCRPPQRCYRCGKEFDPKFLREEHGELVCSNDRCNVVCPVCGEMLGQWEPFFDYQEAYVNSKWATVHLECKKKVDPSFVPSDHPQP